MDFHQKMTRTNHHKKQQACFDYFFKISVFSKATPPKRTCETTNQANNNMAIFVVVFVGPQVPMLPLLR